MLPASILLILGIASTLFTPALGAPTSCPTARGTTARPPATPATNRLVQIDVRVIGPSMILQRTFVD